MRSIKTTTAPLAAKPLGYGLGLMLMAAALAGCQGVDSQTGARTGTGAAVGAAGGATVGLLTGNFLGSTATGAAAGAAGGFVYDQIKKNTDW